MLERQRGEEQLALREIVERREKAQAELAELEQEVPRLRSELEELTLLGTEEDLRLAQIERELEEREAHLRERAATDAGLRDILAAAGEERVERACGELGWLEDEPDAPLA
jgi:hypothetical protein